MKFLNDLKLKVSALFCLQGIIILWIARTVFFNLSSGTNIFTKTVLLLFPIVVLLLSIKLYNDKKRDVQIISFLKANFSLSALMTLPIFLWNPKISTFETASSIVILGLIAAEFIVFLFEFPVIRLPDYKIFIRILSWLLITLISILTIFIFKFSYSIGIAISILIVTISATFAINLYNVFKVKDRLKYSQVRYIFFCFSTITGAYIILSVLQIINSFFDIIQFIQIAIICIASGYVLAFVKYRIFELELFFRTLLWNVSAAIISAWFSSLVIWQALFWLTGFEDLLAIQVLTLLLLISYPSQVQINALVDKFINKDFYKFKTSAELILGELEAITEYNEVYTYLRSIITNHLSLVESELFLVKDDGFYILDPFTLKNWNIALSGEVNDFHLLKNLTFSTQTEQIPALQRSLIKSFDMLLPVSNLDKTIAIWAIKFKEKDNLADSRIATLFNNISKHIGIQLFIASLIKNEDLFTD